MTVTRNVANPMALLERLKVKNDLTPDEEIAVRAAIEEAMAKVDDALRVVLAMIEEIENRKKLEKQNAN